MKRIKNERKFEDMRGYDRRIIQAMDKRHISQSALAREVGLSQPEIFHFRKGKAFPRPVVSQKIAKTLLCSFNWLSFGIGQPNYNTTVYPLEEFWIHPHNRLAYVVWSNNLTLREFLQRFPYKTAPMWFEPYNTFRFPTIDQIDAISAAFSYPADFISNKMLAMRDYTRFFIDEYIKVFGIRPEASQVPRPNEFSL